MKICESTGKIIYESKEEADDIIKRKKQKQKSRRPRRMKPEINQTYSYQCKHCGNWHLAGK